MNDTDKTRLYAVIAETLGIDEEDINDETAPSNTPEWTSLQHLTLLATIEETFDVRFTMDEMARAQSVAALAALVAGYKK